MTAEDWEVNVLCIMVARVTAKTKHGFFGARFLSNLRRDADYATALFGFRSCFPTLTVVDPLAVMAFIGGATEGTPQDGNVEEPRRPRGTAHP